MTQENKNLLLKDLCGRLPYNVKVRVWRRDPNNESKIIAHAEVLDFIMMSIMFKDNIEEYKPYLFPLSSMTEEQMNQFNETLVGTENFGWSNETFDWLNKNHFDYRNLIDKNSAIDCTNLNIY